MNSQPKSPLPPSSAHPAPVLVIGFSRLDQLQSVLSAVEDGHEGEIFVIVDHARDNRPAEAVACDALREWLIAWSSTRPRVRTKLLSANIGVARAIPAGIDWVLESGNDSVIVLEDDCLPAPDFFPFMQEMLERYSSDSRVMMISGNQFLPQSLTQDLDASYYFSKFIHIWGWATWRRAWEHYDHSLSALENPFVSTNLGSLFPGRSEEAFYNAIWMRQRADVNDTAWASRWLLSCLLNTGLCLCPSKNLVRNIGFGEQSTHTKRASRYQVAPLESLARPFIEPKGVFAWEKGDRWWFSHMIARNPFARARRFLNRIDPSRIFDKIEKE